MGEYWNAPLVGKQGKHIHIFRYPEVNSLCGKGPPRFVPFEGDTHPLGKVLWAAWGKGGGRLCKLCERRARGVMAKEVSNGCLQETQV